MLVLTRRVDERIILRTPEGREIQVVHCGFYRANQVRLGFLADSDVLVVREECDDGKLERQNLKRQ